MKKIRKQFYLLLKEKEISVYALAKELGITAQSIYRWIYGTGTPSPQTMLHLTDLLDISAEKVLLLFAEGEQQKKSSKGGTDNHDDE